MGKKGRDKKSSKGRLDKYYHLAKEQGYRARSAFKLIQLNKKYEFLERARVLIDLCAAPGGWLQVATKYMPTSSMIIGVDLAPIKPIPNVITFQDDITTDKCRTHLRQEMKTWKADVVLHDGAPNVGAAWAQDAYSQVELVLMSLKLATDFLCKGGTFVTKVFRSKDYNKLMWVFQQLFAKVEATKPPSSRNVSAEIFVVCRDYLAPKKIDPRFLDSKTVFEELDAGEPAKVSDIFRPEKAKRQREGYEEGNYTLHKKIDVMEFITAQDPVVFLGTYNQMVFESDESRKLLKKSITTEDIKVNCEDLKVLGKRDFKTLLKWRSDLREEFKLDAKEKVQEVVVEEEPLDEDEQLQAELENLTKEEAAKRKRAKRKANEKKMKDIHRMQLNMTAPTDIGIDQMGVDGESLFSIKKIDKETALTRLQKGDMSVADDLADDVNDDDTAMGGALKGRIQQMDTMVVDGSDYEDELDQQLEDDYERYKERKAEKNPKLRAKKARQEFDEWHGFDGKNKEKDDDMSSDSDDSDNDDEAEEQQESSDEDSDIELQQIGALSDDDDDVSTARSVQKRKTGNSLLNDLGHKAAMAKRTASGLSTSASMFFDSDIFQGIDGLDEEDEDDSSEEEKDTLQAAIGSRKRKAEEELQPEDEDNEDDEEESDFEVVQEDDEFADSDDEMWNGVEDENSKAVKRAKEKGLVTPEAVTLALQLANREKTKADLIDEGFSKEAFRDKTGLPEWFLDDEGKHNKPHLPVTKEAVKALREKLKALDARPIKKIAEAKARKKMKMAKRMAKAAKKANDVADNPDMTEKEKLQSINRIVGRASKSKPKKAVKLVVAKGANRGIKGRPTGVKGRYKMVDSVMKKELRAEKRREKKKKKGGRRK
ncbi:Spb1 C-terminal domain-containing protein [Zychaea mexicana]|uniref:Spb1 C-terminal domain-containing protein n=1 Tax=Zychaea mexicana TaxID=64656 RepID=UPI0022FE5E4B|nr:Spb1 C-terminal domain-containing protein [Zychaea mexicana]KAI9484375.1 Spb1 C-terminal domain-containing protein [Zychaea mexicana]